MKHSSLIALLAICSATLSSAASKWVGTWSTAPQLVETGNMPPTPGLTGNTLRQIVRPSIGGDSIRLKLSNDFSTATTTIKAVNVSVSKGSGSIDLATLKPLTFSGKSEVTLNAKSSILSDAIAFPVTKRTDLAITIYFGQVSSTLTGHPGSRTTSYLLAGDQRTSVAFSGAVTTDHWYVINMINVSAPESSASVAILGNSITDGRGSTTNLQDRWTDIFSEALLKNPGTSHVGVLNLGIGGNCVLSGGLGPTGASRYQRDILDQQGVKWVMILEGVNDIGGVSTAATSTTMASNLIAAYKQMISDAHAKSLKVYGATIMPFGGNGYYNQYSESCRNTVNRWIRTGGFYDAVVDFDKIMRNPTDTTKLVSTYQNDGLHPDAAGYKTMGESVDLNLFSTSTTSIPTGKPAKPKATFQARNKSIAIEYGTRRIDGATAARKK
jgi:lysophospholipase L1-like esterase